jgi:hypothetical protein
MLSSSDFIISQTNNESTMIITKLFILENSLRSNEVMLNYQILKNFTKSRIIETPEKIYDIK